MKSDSEREIRNLETERQNFASEGLDTRSSLEIARIINAEDAKVAAAVERALPQIAEAIDAIAAAIAAGGRLIYVGAGTSGRIAALDAAECPATFNSHPNTVQFVIAGGTRALGRATEAYEDSRKLGERDLAKKKPTRKDVVVGIAASGRTPYTLAAIRYGRKRGAKTVAVTSSRNSPLAQAADIAIVAQVGAEVLAGSTRMKAATAHKMILNMLSTGAMARLGYVYGNLMVNVPAKNQKLLERGIMILEAAAGVDRDTAWRALAEAKSVAVALVMLKAGVSRAEAQRRLKWAHGNVRKAIGDMP